MRCGIKPALCVGLSLYGVVRSLPAAAPVDVVVSVAPMAELIERVGGPGVRVVTLLPPGAAPETWAPTPAQALSVARADLYVEVGHPSLTLEERYLSPIAARSEGLDRLALGQVGGSETGGGDPHLWMDLDALAWLARHFSDWLQRRQPERAAAIQRDMDLYLTEIREVDADLRRMLAPPSGRPVVSQHPAWERLLGRYGVASLAIESDGKEPAPATLVALIERARELGVETVFTQVGVSDRSARLLASELGAELVALDPMARDWLNNLRAAGSSFARASR